MGRAPSFPGFGNGRSPPGRRPPAERRAGDHILPSVSVRPSVRPSVSVNSVPPWFDPVRPSVARQRTPQAVRFSGKINHGDSEDTEGFSRSGPGIGRAASIPTAGAEAVVYG